MASRSSHGLRCRRYLGQWGRWLLLWGSVGVAYGQDPGAVAADRPGFGDGAAVVAPGRFQVEAGYTVAHTERVRQHRIGQVVLRFGVSERLELHALLNSFVVLDYPPPPPCPREGSGGTLPASSFPGGCPGDSRDEHGFEDQALGVKVNLLEGSGTAPGQPMVTAIMNLALPNGNEEFSSNDLRPELKLAFDLALNRGLAFSGNAGYAFTFADGASDRFFTYASLAAAVPGVDGLSLFAGLYSLFPGITGEAVHGLDGGVILLLNAATQVDVNIAVGLTDGAPRYAAGAGIARRF